MSIISIAIIASCGGTAILGLYLLYLLIPQWDGWLGRMRLKHRGQKIAVLTFDDGPDEPWTSQILGILQTEGIRSSFFVLGQKALRHPDLIRRMTADGHEVENHSYDHKKFLFRNRRVISEGIMMTSNIIERTCGAMPRFIRTPHGFKTPGIRGILRRLDLRLIPWTKGIWDTDGSDEERLFKRFTKKFADLEILLLHDGVDESLTSKDRGATVRVLPRMIAEYRNRGYEFRRISEL